MAPTVVNRPLPKGPEAAPGLFPKVLLGMGATAAMFAGFWYLLRNRQDRKVATGTNPHYEQLMTKQANAKYYSLPPLASSRVETHDHALDAPWREHNHHHTTLEQLKANADYSLEMRYQVPPPQRGKKDEIDHAYTKSPAYADNYQKTSRAKNHKANGNGTGTNGDGGVEASASRAA
ncbi:hypothetical protein AX16_008185 [Volvariella volvacea WC 439]|nr:hypothetical protein AX16_008185 [Volvariella volvacea WC 439]